MAIGCLGDKALFGGARGGFGCPWFIVWPAKRLQTIWLVVTPFALAFKQQLHCLFITALIIETHDAAVEMSGLAQLACPFGKEPIPQDVDSWP